MTRLHPLLPGRAALTGLDLLFAAWAIVWVAIGLSIAHEVKGLAELSDTVSTVGRAVDEVGRQLGSVGSLPLVGDRLEAPATRIREAGQSALQSGRSSRESVNDLSVLLGLAVAVIPSLPLLVLYVPLRAARLREAGALRRTLREAGDDPQLEELLARRAVQNLPYHRLARVTRTPWRDLADGRYAALAAAEKQRVGIRTARLADRRR